MNQNIISFTEGYETLLKQEYEMNREIHRWKTYAKETLKGNFSIPIFSLLAIAGINMLISQLTGALFRGGSVFNIVISQLFLFIVTLIMGIFSAGLSCMLLNMARGNAYSFRDLLYFFKNHPDRVIVVGFVMGIIDLVVSIPYFYVSYFMDPGTTLEEQLDWLMRLGLMLLISIILNFLITLPMSLTYYFLADDLNLGGIDAIKKSIKVMKGKILKYFFLQVSFLPLFVLSVFTLYIALLWIIPYMEMSSVMFYRDCIGEFIPEKPGYDTPYSLSREAEEKFQNDDFNSEA